MTAPAPIRCTVATPGVEVVTVRLPDATCLTTIHGGRLDGDSFPCSIDPDAEHERACLLARMAAWPRRRRRRRLLPA